MPNEDLENIAITIRVLREAADLTVEHAASIAGIETSLWHRTERAKYDPSISELRNIAAALDVPVGALFAATTT